MTKNKQNLKKINYFFLFSMALASNMQASDNSFENLKSSSLAEKYSISREEPKLTLREMRLHLFDLDKFDNSFDSESDVFAQMHNRNIVWQKPEFNSYVQQEILRHIPTQNKIMDYIPYYFKEILDIKSANDLKFKSKYFFDLINLISLVYKNLDGMQQLRQMEMELSNIDFDRYSLFPMFLRYSASQNNRTIQCRFPAFIQSKVDNVYSDNQLDKPYKYHKSLEEKCKMDQKWLEKFAELNTIVCRRFRETYKYP